MSEQIMFATSDFASNPEPRCLVTGVQTCALPIYFAAGCFWFYER